MKENKIQTARFPIWVGAGFIFLLAFVAYWPALRGSFVWDDNVMVKENLLVTGSDGLFSLWFSTTPIDYFPLTYSSLWLEWRLWGLNVTGYHVTNLLFHAASCVLLWRVLAQLKIPGAWVASLLFLVHPVNVESVAWIAERKNTLSLFFYFLSTLFYLRSEQPPDPKSENSSQQKFYWLSLAAFLLSLLSKTAGVALPLVLLGTAWWQRRTITRSDLLRSLPFFGLALVMGLVTIWFQYNRAIAAQIIHTRDFWAKLASAGWAVWFYLWKTVWPVNLSFVYSEWTVNTHSMLSYLPGIALIGIFILLWRFRNSWGRPWLFAFSYFVLLLFPVLGFFKIYFQKFSFVADHWQYFSLPAVVALIAAALQRLSMVQVRRALEGVLIAGLAILTWRQALIYRTEESVWRDTLKKNPRCWLAYNNLAFLFKNQGKRAEAIEYNLRSLKIRPAQAEASHNLGLLYQEDGRLDAAMEQYKAVLAVDPNNTETRVNIGVILNLCGDRTNAMAAFRETLRIDPKHSEAHNNLGGLLLIEGKFAEAIPHFREALKRKPDSADVLSNLGSALIQQGKAQEALGYLTKAVEIKPDHANAHLNLGNALLETQRFSEAIAEYEAVLRLKPDFTFARFKSGFAFLGLRKIDEAMRQFLIVVTQEPKSAEAHYQLAFIYNVKKDKQQSLEHLRETVRLRPDWLEALNNLAWILATDSKATDLDKKDALRFARRAAEITEYKDAATLDTLAAACAQAEQFAEAIDFSQKANELALAANQTNLATQIRSRLELYRNGKPYREP